ncbi:MAG: hypothetical protein K2O00_01480 [Muribaculaceae bacterium]|nr:hypothetical protein [Muribaculaceae bacterium]
MKNFITTSFLLIFAMYNLFADDTTIPIKEDPENNIEIEPRPRHLLGKSWVKVNWGSSDGYYNNVYVNTSFISGDFVSGGPFPIKGLKVIAYPYQN